jgi:hypothetical protein
LHQFDEEYNIPQQPPLPTNVVALATMLPCDVLSNLNSLHPLHKFAFLIICKPNKSENNARKKYFKKMK